MTSRYDSSVIGIDMVNAGDTATTNSWMIGLNFKDVFIEGNKAGFAIGGVPSVSSNDSGWGTDGSMPILGITPGGLHQRVPLVFGAAEEVAEVAAAYAAETSGA